MGYRRTVRPPPAAWRVLAVAAVAAGAGGCELPGFGAPDPKSTQGETIYSLWQGFFLASLAVGGLVWGLIVFVIVRYRRGRTGDDLPSQRAYNIPLEIVYTAVPIVIVAVLFGVSWAAQGRVTDVGPDPAARVDVIGFHWSWQFAYPDEDVVVTGEPGRGPRAGAPRGPARAAAADQRRRHPLVLGAGVPVEARPDPRRRQHHRRDADRDRRVRRALRRVLRARPLADELLGAGGDRGRVRGVARRAAGRGGRRSARPRGRRRAGDVADDHARGPAAGLRGAPGAARGARPGPAGVPHDHRPQAHRHRLHGHRVRLLPRGRRAGRW